MALLENNAIALIFPEIHRRISELFSIALNGIFVCRIIKEFARGKMAERFFPCKDFSGRD